MGVHSTDEASFSRNVKFVDGAGTKRRNGFIIVDEDENGINAKFEDINGKSDMKRLRDNKNLDTISQTGIGEGFQSNGNDHIPIGPDDRIDNSSFRPRKVITFRSNGELDNTGPKFKSSLENFGQSKTGKNNLGAKTLTDKGLGNTSLRNKGSFQVFVNISKTQHGDSDGLHSKIFFSKKTGNVDDLESRNDNRHGNEDLSGGLGISQAVKFQTNKKQSGISRNRKDNPGNGFQTADETRLGQGVGGNLAIKGKAHFKGNNDVGISSPHSVSAQIKNDNGHENGGISKSFALGKHIEFEHDGELISNGQNSKNELGKNLVSKDKSDLGVNFDTSRNSRMGKHTFEDNGAHFDNDHRINSPLIESTQTQKEDGHVSEHMVNSLALGKHAEFGFNGQLVDNGQSVKNNHGKKITFKDKTHVGQSENLGVNFDTVRNSRIQNDAITESGIDFEGNTGNEMISHQSISIQAENVDEHEIKDIFDSFGLGKLIELGHEGEIVDNGKNNKDGNGKKFGATDELTLAQTLMSEMMLSWKAELILKENNDNGMTSHHSTAYKELMNIKVKIFSILRVMENLLNLDAKVNCPDNGKNNKDINGKKFGGTDEIDISRNSHVRNDAILESGDNLEGNNGNGMKSHHIISIEAKNVNEHEIKDIFDSFGLGKLIELGHEGEIVDNGKNNKDGNGKKFGGTDEIDISTNSHVRNDAILEGGANFEGNNDNGMTSHHSISVQGINDISKDIFDTSGHGKLTEFGRESKLVDNGKNNKNINGKKFGGTDEIDISRNSHVRNDDILESGDNLEGNNGNGMKSHHIISIEADNVNEHEIKDIFDSFGLGKLTEFGQEGELIYNGKNNKKFGSRDEIDNSRNSRVKNDAILESGTNFEGNNGNGRTSHRSISVEAENVNEHEIKDISDSSGHGKYTQFGHEGELVGNGKNNNDGNGNKFGRTDEIDISTNSHVRNDAILDSGANFEGNNGNGMTSHHSISIQAEDVNEHEIKYIFDSFGLGKLIEFEQEGELIYNGKNNKNFGDEIDISRNSHDQNDAIVESGTNFEENNGNGMTSHRSISVEVENVHEHEIKDIFDSFGLGKLANFGYKSERVYNDKISKDGNGKNFRGEDEVDSSRNFHVRSGAIQESGADFDGNTLDGMTSHHSISVQAENANEDEIKDISDSFGLGKLTEFEQEGELIYNGKNNKNFGDEIDISRNSHVQNDAIVESGTNFEENNGNGMVSHHSFSVEAENVNEQEIKDIFDSFGVGRLTEVGHGGEFVDNYGQSGMNGYGKKIVSKYDTSIGNSDELGVNLNYRRNSGIRNDATLESGADFLGNTDHGRLSHHSYSVEGHENGDGLDSVVFKKHVKYEYEGELDDIGQSGGENFVSRDEAYIGQSNNLGVNLDSRDSRVRNSAALGSGADFEGNTGHEITFHHSYSSETQNDDGDLSDSYVYEKHVKYGFEGEPADIGPSYEESRDAPHIGQSDDLGVNLDISRNSRFRNGVTLESGADFERNTGHVKTFDHSYGAQTQNGDGHESGSISRSISLVKSVNYGGDSELGSIGLTDTNSHGRRFGLGHRTHLMQSDDHRVDFGNDNHLGLEDDLSKGLSNRGRFRIKNGSGNDIGPEMQVKFGRDVNMDNGNKVVRKEYVQTKVSDHMYYYLMYGTRVTLKILRYSEVLKV
ncbi:UNVERIFIED_CONTAM: spidroin protein Sp-14910-B [Trichonephila clavipes]